MTRRISTLALAALALALLLLVGPSACNVVAGLDGLRFADDDAGAPCASAAACDDQNPCTTDTCGEGGVCAHAPSADGPSDAQVQGDCRTAICTGGEASEVLDLKDIEDDHQPCTTDACEGGTTTHIPAADATPCLIGEAKGACQGGACVVECGPAKPPCDDQEPCTADTCVVETGQCSFVPLVDGAPNPAVPDVMGDCQAAVCVGGKGQVIDDDQDLPSFPGDCQVGQCTLGQPSAKLFPVDMGCASGGGQVCDGNGACVACNADAQCGLTDECRANVCAAHACTVSFTANHTPVATQVPGDCVRNVCDGAGNVVSEDDDADPMGDGNPCTDDLCQGGAPQHPNSMVNTACGVGLVCDGMGACVGCVNNGQCNAPETCGGCGTAGVCCCMPTTCASLGLQCGSAPDGCGGMLTCNDGKNNGETDVDCGGPSCSVKCAQGKTCNANADCAGGACADGVCCDSACDGACQACNLPGKVGACSPILAGVDVSPANICSGASACDATGTCRKINGQVCPGGDADCVSGFCADGVCCVGACAGQCKACNVAGSVGSCANVPAGLPDDDATLVCNGGNACNGGGLCKKQSAQPCAMNADCLSGFCADGVCCNGTCSTTCQSCVVPGSEGVCTNMPVGQPDNNATISCNGGNVCNGGIGFNACKKAIGQGCAFGAECVANVCVDGVCCSSACNTACHSCNLPGSVGTCANLTSGTDDVPVNACVAPSACDASGTCKATNGQLCGSGLDCVSGSCADGVCCNQACNGTCLSCTAALKGAGADGVCGPTMAGTDPADECVLAELCDGMGACQ